MDINAQLDYMYGLSRYGIRLGLDVMESLMAELGHPESQFQSIHIVGTNGKGSTAVMLEAPLRAAGLKAALYTSPHIYRFNERIKVDNQEISDETLSQIVQEVKQAAVRAGLEPTFFEFTTAIAFLYFAREEVDIAVIEAGMGAKLDATNVITPELTIITNIDLDHTDLLGPTKLDIAADKAAAIKSGVPVITGETDPEILKYIEEVAKKNKTQIVGVIPELLALPRISGIQTGIQVPLSGTHQQQNAACALEALKHLNIDPKYIGIGWKNLAWEGRLDVVSQHPYVLVDGAHNEAAFSALYDFVKDKKFVTLVVALKSGKTSPTLSNKISELAEHIICTEGVYNPMLAEELSKSFSNHPNVTSIPDAATATQKALDLAGSEGSVLITGSLYMIPVALAHLRNKPHIGPLTP